MEIKTKEKILRCTLALASENGLGNVSLSMIAEKVGVRKASLFSHFKSKDDIIQSLYEYLRGKAKSKQAAPPDYGVLMQGKSAQQVLQAVVGNYQNMNSQKDLLDFYKFIYSQRAINPAAAMIMLTETETMLRQTKALFAAMEQKGLLNFQGKDMDLAAAMFCLTVHELMDIERDRQLNNLGGDEGTDIHKFIAGFCALYA